MKVSGLNVLGRVEHRKHRLHDGAATNHPSQQTAHSRYQQQHYQSHRQLKYGRLCHGVAVQPDGHKKCRIAGWAGLGQHVYFLYSVGIRAFQHAVAARLDCPLEHRVADLFANSG